MSLSMHAGRWEARMPQVHRAPGQLHLVGHAVLVRRVGGARLPGGQEQGGRGAHQDEIVFLNKGPSVERK